MVHTSHGAGLNAPRAFYRLEPSDVIDRDFGIKVGDFNGDNRSDVLIKKSQCTKEDCFRVYLNEGGNRFKSGVNFGGDFTPRGNNYGKDDFYIRDVDLDGRDDLIYQGICEDGTERWKYHLSHGESFITTCSVFPLVPKPTGGADTAPSTYGLESTGGTDRSGGTTVKPAVSCDDGFVRVPGNSQYGTQDFCVMKYEAKKSGAKAVSVSAGSPWVNLSRAEATAACGGLRL